MHRGVKPRILAGGCCSRGFTRPSLRLVFPRLSSQDTQGRWPLRTSDQSRFQSSAAQKPLPSASFHTRSKSQEAELFSRHQDQRQLEVKYGKSVISDFTYAHST